LTKLTQLYLSGIRSPPKLAL